MDNIGPRIGFLSKGSYGGVVYGCQGVYFVMNVLEDPEGNRARKYSGPYIRATQQ